MLSECRNRKRAEFGESSSLESRGEAAFSESGVIEIRIPDDVGELCDECFSECRNRKRALVLVSHQW